MNTCIKPDGYDQPELPFELYDSHEPTDWRYGIQDKNDLVIAENMRKNHAEYFINTANSRAALVEALNDAGWYLTHPDEVGKIQLDILLEEIRSALAAAKGEK